MTRRRIPAERTRPLAAALRSRALAVAAAGLVLLGCSAILEREHDQCRTSQDCQHLAAGAVCTSSGVCEEVSLPGSTGRTGVRVCERDTDCDGSDLCLGDACRDLAALGCEVLSSPGTDDRMPFAFFLPDPPEEARRIRAAFEVIVQDWNDAREVESQPPPILGVACSARDPLQRGAVAAAGFPVVVAATRTAELMLVLESLQGRSLVFAPFAEAPGLPSLVQGEESSVVACRPSRAGDAAATLSAVSHLRSTRASRSGPEIVALSDNEVRFGYETPSLDLSESVMTYDPASAGADLVRMLDEASIHPSLLVAVSTEEDWSSIIGAVETGSNFAGQPPPFYFLTGRRGDLLAALHQGGRQGPRYERAAMLDYHREARNREIHERFARSFTNATTYAATPDLDYVQDCFYVAAYAAVAAQIRLSFLPQRLGWRGVLTSLNALVGGEPIAVGPEHVAEAYSELLANVGSARSMDLVGGSGDLEFVELPSPEEAVSPLGLYVAPKPAAEELLCVDADGYCETGLTISHDGELAGVNQCSCLAIQ